MGLFEQLPYTNFHELNLTELVKLIKDLAREMHEFEVVNKISYGGDWDITTQYPAWTIVCVNGTEGYISIQPVPMGVDYTNTDYWRLVADFTVQLADLGNRVSTLEGEMVTANNNIGTLNGQMTTANNNISALTLRANQVSSNLNGRRYIVVSDSYGNYPTASTSFIAQLQSMLNISNDNYFKVARNGSGFIGNPGIDTFETILTNESGNITNHDTITDILVVGGYNDANSLYSGTTTIQMITAITDFINYCATTYPNAVVHVLPVAWCYQNNHLHKFISEFCSVCCQIVKPNYVYSQAILYTLHDTIMLDNTYIHPSTYGANTIAQSIGQYLHGGSGYNLGSLGSIAPTKTLNDPTVTALTLSDETMTMNNSTACYSFSIGTMSVNNLSLSSNTDFKICDFNRTFMVGGHLIQQGYSALTYMRVAGVDYPVILSIHDNCLCFRTINYTFTSYTGTVYFYATMLTGSSML